MTLSSDRNRQFRLKNRPEGNVQRSDFDYVEGPIPELGPNQVLARTLYLSLDPTNRIWMNDVPQYMPPVALGEVMRGSGIAQVVKSTSDAFAPGDLVGGLVGWQDYVVADASGPRSFMRVPRGLPVPLPTLLGALGMTGMTAYFGLLDIGQPRAGETVVVSAAAGATGSVVGQIAKIKGCRAVGIAGSREKCDWLTGELGFDAAVNYKDPEWKEALKQACPNGIDVSFENVGGDIMETVMGGMNMFGRVVLCGLISGYNKGGRMRGPFDTILMKRLRVQGFIIIDYAARFSEASKELAQWVADGRVKHKDTIVEGLLAAPEALNRLFDGSTMGKLLIHVSDPPIPL